MNIACVNFSLDKKRLSPPRLWPCQQLFTFFLGQRFKTVIMSNIPVEKKSRKTRNTLKTESSVIELLGSFCFLLQLSWRREVAPKYISGIARSIACCMLPSSRTITDFQSILQTYCLETWPESRSSGVFSSVVPNLIAVSRIEIWGRGECEPWTRKARGVMVKMIPRLIKAYIKAWPCENKNILAPWIIFICHVAIICWYIWDSSVQSLYHIQLFATPWTAARQASLSITSSRSLLKLMSITWGMPSNHLILCHPCFSFCLQSFPASGSFPMSQLFASGGQSIRISTSTSVLPVNI